MSTRTLITAEEFARIPNRKINPSSWNSTKEK